MPRDILARDAAILIRACASNERRSVDARVGLNLRRLLGARNVVAQAHNRRRRTSTSVLAVDDDLHPSRSTRDVPRSPAGHGLSS